MKWLPWIVSVLAHLGLLLAGLLMPQKPEYGVQAGKNSIEVNLVAASAPPAPSAPTPPEPVPPPVSDPDPDMAAVPPPPPAPIPPPPQPEPPKPTPPVPPVPQVAKATPEHGDASSPNPGKDAVSAHSDAGAILTVKPDYLSNPPPDYPEGSRRRKEEGLVVLDVIVGVSGRAESVVLSASSGFAELDGSARAAVSGWRFRAATLGGIKVRSRVTVPVRFRLDS